jgi:hypothetical protein
VEHADRFKDPIREKTMRRIGLGLLLILATLLTFPLAALARVAPGTIGLRLAVRFEQVIVADVTPDGPAAQAGMEVGSRLLSINGNPVPRTQSQVDALLKGPPGSEIRITLHDPNGMLRNFILRRAGADEETNAAAPRPIDPLDWTIWTNRRGMDLRVPPKWTATAWGFAGGGFANDAGGTASPQPAGGWTLVSGPGHQGVLIAPAFVSGPLDAASGPVVLEALARQFNAAATWSQPLALGADRAFLSGRGTDGGALLAILRWEPAPQGSVAMLTVLFAPDLAAARDTLAALLSSVHIHGRNGAPPPLMAPLTAMQPRPPTARGPAVPPPPPVSYLLFTEPTEQAFTDEVPAGWAIQGQARRFGPDNLRPGVLAVGPDRDAVAFLGDPDLVHQVYRVPDYTMTQRGLVDGSPLPSPDGVSPPETIGHAESGRRFADDFLIMRLRALDQGNCLTPVIDKEEDLPDIGAQANAVLAPFHAQGIDAHVEAGIVRFHCDRNILGAVAATVLQVTGGGITEWYATDLAGWTGTPVLALQAMGVAARMERSFHPNPRPGTIPTLTVPGAAMLNATLETMAANLRAALADRIENDDRLVPPQPGATPGLIEIRTENGAAYQVWNDADYRYLTADGLVWGNRAPPPPLPDAAEIEQIQSVGRP